MSHTPRDVVRQEIAGLPLHERQARADALGYDAYHLTCQSKGCGHEILHYLVERVQRHGHPTHDTSDAAADARFHACPKCGGKSWDIKDSPKYEAPKEEATASADPQD